MWDFDPHFGTLNFGTQRFTFIANIPYCFNLRSLEDKFKKFPSECWGFILSQGPNCDLKTCRIQRFCDNHE